jgi:nicotinamidase-related amidase
MSISQLESHAALIVIDMQKGIVSLPTVHPAEEIIANNAKLARAFRTHGFPVVLVNVAGGAPGRTDVAYNFKPPADWAELIPELEAHPNDHKITKLQWGAFHGTSLDHHLRRRGVTQVILTGIATSIGVESTARNAHDHGYHVVLVTDAMTDMDSVAHQHSIEKIFPRLGETTTTAEVLSLLGNIPGK